MNEMINIYIVKHKKSWSPSMDGFVPIQVGAFQSKDKICEVTDATKKIFLQRMPLIVN